MLPFRPLGTILVNITWSYEANERWSSIHAEKDHIHQDKLESLFFGISTTLQNRFGDLLHQFNPRNEPNPETAAIMECLEEYLTQLETDATGQIPQSNSS